MATIPTFDDILDGFYRIQNALESVREMSTTQVQTPDTPIYRFGQLAGLLAQEQAALWSDLQDYHEWRERQGRTPNQGVSNADA